MSRFRTLLCACVVAWSTAIFATESTFHKELWGKDVLLVVDTRSYFGSTKVDEELRKNIAKDIQQAMEVKKLIIFLDYSGLRTPTSSLDHLTENYPYKVKLKKTTKSGYLALYSFLENQRLRFVREVRICGVDLDGNIESLVHDLCLFNYNLRIAEGNEQYKCPNLETDFFELQTQSDKKITDDYVKRRDLETLEKYLHSFEIDSESHDYASRHIIDNYAAKGDMDGLEHFVLKNLSLSNPLRAYAMKIIMNYFEYVNYRNGR